MHILNNFKLLQQQTVYDMVTISIKIVPVFDEYITQFISLDHSIPRIFTETIKIIAEYRNSKVSI